MLTVVVIAASLVGLVLAGISLLIQRVEGSASFLKSLADLLLRLSIVTFAIAAGFFAFFGQRWLEDVNSKIDEANEALANMDIIQSEYMSEVEAAYYLNDNQFLDAKNACESLLKKYDEDAAYCYREIADGGDIKGGNLLDALNYFDFQMPNAFVADFGTKFYQQSFIKRAVRSDLLGRVFRVHANLVERYGIMRDQLINLRALAEKDTSRKLLTKLNSETKIGASKNADMAVLTHRVCCVVGVLRDEAERIKTYATQQAENFCAVRDEIMSAVKDATGSTVSLLARPRVQELEQHINGVRQAKGCTYDPLPLSEED